MARSIPATNCTGESCRHKEQFVHTYNRKSWTRWQKSASALPPSPLRDGKARFIPKGIKSADRLSFYAEHFDTVEIDSTFYACPSPRLWRVGRAKTPRGFHLFACKVPQIITHEKVLVDCDAELKQFVDTMGILGEKLGPMVLQFPFFNKRCSNRKPIFWIA